MCEMSLNNHHRNKVDLFNSDVVQTRKSFAFGFHILQGDFQHVKNVDERTPLVVFDSTNIFQRQRQRDVFHDDWNDFSFPLILK